MSLDDYRGRDQDFYAGCALEDAGQCRHPNTWSASVDDYVWHFDSQLQVARIRTSSLEQTFTPEQALAWLANEVDLWDGCRSSGPITGERYYREMTEWWLSKADEPITVTLENGYYWVWGGYHRYAISVAHGVETIPAIVGTRPCN